MLLSTVAVTVYIPTNKCIRILFCLRCPQHLLFLVFLITVVLTCSSLVMLNIFSCVFWPFVCFLWKKKTSDLFFLIRYISFCCWDIWVLYIFWILIHYQIYALQAFFFPLFDNCLFILLMVSFAVWKPFSLIHSHWLYLLLFWFWTQIQKIVETDVKEFATYDFY